MRYRGPTLIVPWLLRQPPQPSHGRVAGDGRVIVRRAIWPAALLALGCAEASRTTDGPKTSTEALRLPRAMVGCYALYDQEGTPASRSLYFASDRIRLDSAAWARPNTWKAMRLRANGRTPADGRDGRFVYWAADSLKADTIHIMIHSGFSGSELILGLPPAPTDTLYGRALEHWDMGPSTTDGGPVTAVRVPCVADADR